MTTPRRRPQPQPRQPAPPRQAPAPPWCGWWRSRERGSRWILLASGPTYSACLTALLDAMTAQGRRNGDAQVLVGTAHPGRVQGGGYGPDCRSSGQGGRE